MAQQGRRAAVALMIGATAFAGCGDGDGAQTKDPEEQVRVAVKEFYAAAGADDARELCDTLTASAQRSIARSSGCAASGPPDARGRPRRSSTRSSDAPRPAAPRSRR